MPSLFVDVNVPMYAAGSEHPYRLPAQRIILSIAGGGLDACTDAEVLQEILYRYRGPSQRSHGLRIFDLFLRIMGGRLLAIDEEVLGHARTLADGHPALGPRELIHLAVMKANGLTVIATADRHFDGIDGIERLGPDRWS